MNELTLLQIADGLNDYADRVNEEQAELQLVTPDGEVLAAGPILKEKLNSYGYRIETCLMIARTQAAIAEAAKKKADAAKSAVEFLEGQLKAFMEITGTEELRVGRYAATNYVNPRAVSTVVEIAPESLPPQFQRVKVEADLTAIKKEILGGGKVEGCYLSEPARKLKMEVVE